MQTVAITSGRRKAWRELQRALLPSSSLQGEGRRVKVDILNF
jgi:hypothetical protein